MEDPDEVKIFSLRVPGTEAEKNAWKASASISGEWFGEFVRRTLNAAVSGHPVHIDMQTLQCNSSIRESKSS